MNHSKKMTSMEFDSIVPVDDLCMAAGLICVSQKRALRHYVFNDGRELTLNTARNEWAMKNPDCYGSASQLVKKLGLTRLTEGDNFGIAFSLVEKLYTERDSIPPTFGYMPISKPTWDFTDTCHPKNPALGRLMTRYGLSMDNVKLHTLEGSMPHVKSQKPERVLAMSVSKDSESFIAFNGKVFRQIGEAGMSTVGQRRRDQICMVYENPLDFLTLMESVIRNDVYPIMARRYHIILNGKRGLAEACEYLKSNPDFLEVRCFMPKNEFGQTAFAAINDAVKGTAIDRSDLFHGFGSLFEKYRPKVPESYRKWEVSQVKKESKVDVSETKNVGQKEMTPKIKKRLSSGVEKSAIIDRKEGGLKL
ncbi:MAG: hypothetical protein K2N05_02630 [Muribaculaceae bacterium]|nr:hypothetical protein [Muribaculaceae bacterium]